MRRGLLVALALTVAVAVGVQFLPTEPDERTPAGVVVAASAGGYSNILTTDYVGPKKCGECHEDKYEEWWNGGHRRMNQLAVEGNVVADFSGVSVEYAGGKATFTRRGEDYVMELVGPDGARRVIKITRTIGFRYRQEYIGTQIEGPEPEGHEVYEHETMTAWAWLFATKRWYPVAYFHWFPNEAEYHANGAMRRNPYEQDDQPFETRCIYCHNTYTYTARLDRPVASRGFIDEPPPEALKALGIEPITDDFDYSMRIPFPKDALITVGISCESCHFGGREHSEHEKDMRFVPSHPALEGWSPPHEGARDDPMIINQICAQCHVSGGVRYPDGSSRLNSFESGEMAAGACWGSIKCTDCHDPHTRGPAAGAPDRPEHIAACLKCHEQYEEPAAARAHHKHDAEISCLDCHMPRTVHGILDDVMNRTHRISSPTERKILDNGLPNACNLCHLDQSVAWAVENMREWSPDLKLPKAPEAALTTPAGDLFLKHPLGALRAVIADAWARSPMRKEAIPKLLDGLLDDNAYIRFRFQLIVEKAMGRPFTRDEYDVMAPPDERGQQVEALRTARAL